MKTQIKTSNHSETESVAVEMTAANTASPAPALANSNDKKRVLGFDFLDVSLEQAARMLVRSAAIDVRRKVYFINAHCINVSRRNRAYANIVDDASVLFADGIGMRIAAKIENTRLDNNVNGTDLFDHLCAEAAKQSMPLALYGAAPGRAAALAERLQATYPGINVVWADHGYHSHHESERIIREINESGAKLLLVAKGVPLQEIWIHNHFSDLRAPVVMGVGALFDYDSGGVPRAPKFMRAMHLEWLFRLMMEPKRLFSRYVIGNPLFLSRVLWRRLRGYHKHGVEQQN